jgi:hypothetical protein
MKTGLKNKLDKLCLEFTEKYENRFENYPIGTCYIVGHCLTEGLKRAGYIAKKVTGTHILKDKNEKNIIYGKSIIKGKNIGYYHTWCVLEIDDEVIIIDPSYKYNKKGVNINPVKPNPKIPDFIITADSKQWLYCYYPDETLSHLSDFLLNQISGELIQAIINDVFECVIKNLYEGKLSA